MGRPPDVKQLSHEDTLAFFAGNEKSFRLSPMESRTCLSSSCADPAGEASWIHRTSIGHPDRIPTATHVRLVINSAWGSLLDQCGLSEVRFFHVPVLAREPQPASGRADVPPDVVLGWRSGREAASHEVYIGTDASDLPLAGTVSGNSYDTTPLDLQLGEIYYWKINEVNNAATPGSWEGETWSFSTPEYLVVDDFESYDDDVEAGTTIFDTWIDGVTNNTGSTVGYWTAPFAEQTIVLGGTQSMPLTFDNSAATSSEAERIFDVSQDWSRAGIQTLTLFFYGTQGNTGQMYVKIDGKKVAYAGAADAIAKPWWTQWNIDLGSVGVDLQNVTKLTIGIEGAGSGIVYIDDIRLYRMAPVPPREAIWLQAEAAETVTAPMKVYDDDPTAMDGKYIGTDDAIGNSSDNPPTPDGTATYTFTVQGGVYKISGRVIIPGGESFWVRIPGATTQTLNDTSGWVKWSDPPQGHNWHWAEVFSADDGNVVVQFTMAAGTYELEIGYREDGAWLDAIVIESVD